MYSILSHMNILYNENDIPIVKQLSINCFIVPITYFR